MTKQEEEGTFIFWFGGTAKRIVLDRTAHVSIGPMTLSHREGVPDEEELAIMELAKKLIAMSRRKKH